MAHRIGSKAMTDTRSSPGIGDALPPVQRIEMVSSSSGYEMPSEPMWRVTVDKYCIDFETETAANNVRNAILALCGVAQAGRHPEDRTIFVLQEIARGRCDNGRPLGGETARQMARAALDNWPGRASSLPSTTRDTQ
jgi:hypothetical protein